MYRLLSSKIRATDFADKFIRIHVGPLLVVGGMVWRLAVMAKRGQAIKERSNPSGTRRCINAGLTPLGAGPALSHHLVFVRGLSFDLFLGAILCLVNEWT